MTRFEKWGCPHCKQRCPRHWNMVVHIRRRHGGIGEPVELEKSRHGETSSPSGSNKNNANNDSFGRSVPSRIFPKPPSRETNKISKRHNIWPGSDIIDQHYQMALEFEENQKKIMKINEIYSQFPFSTIQGKSAQPFKFSLENTSEPPIPTAGTPFQKIDSISLPGESNRANDYDKRRITESHRTTQEKPEKPTFDEYRRSRPGLTFDDYRKIGRTPVTDWELVSSGKGWVKRNVFGETIDFTF